MSARAVALVALALAATPASAADYEWPVVKVIDGDTVRVDASADMPPELASIAVRLRGVNTPEKGRWAKCAEEKRMAAAATDFAKRAIAASLRVVVRDPKWGKYGGRVIADLVLDGHRLSDLLIDAGHGRPYAGGKRRGWC